MTKHKSKAFKNERDPARVQQVERALVIAGVTTLVVFAGIFMLFGFLDWLGANL